MLLHVGNFHQKNVATADYIGYNFNINYTFDMWGQSHGPRIFFFLLFEGYNFHEICSGQVSFFTFSMKEMQQATDSVNFRIDRHNYVRFLPNHRSLFWNN